MRTVEELTGREISSPGIDRARTRKKAPSKAAKPTKPKSRRPATVAKTIAIAVDAQPGTLPVLYMLSPQKFMSPFDCNMALDSGYKVVLPYSAVTVDETRALVQDAIFSRPPKAKTGIFIGGKDITCALDMMSAARSAMVPPFDVSVFADPGGSFTTAAAMVAKVERALKRSAGRTIKGLRVSVFGAAGVVGFTSAVIAAREGAKVRIVAHDTIEQLVALAEFARERFGVTLEPVAGQTDTLKAKVLAISDVVLTAGPAGVNILSRSMIARAPNVLVAADVNAVPPYGVEGMDLFMDGAPLPGSSTLGVGALAIGDVKYKTQAGLFRRMLTETAILDLDFRDAFVLAREIVSDKPAKAKPAEAKRGRRKAA